MCVYISLSSYSDIHTETFQYFFRLCVCVYVSLAIRKHECAIPSSVRAPFQPLLYGKLVSLHPRKLESFSNLKAHYMLGLFSSCVLCLPVLSSPLPSRTLALSFGLCLFFLSLFLFFTHSSEIESLQGLWGNTSNVTISVIQTR